MKIEINMTDEDYSTKELILSDDKIFYTIEGEGEFVGQPSVFMRLSMCNLTCIGFASPDSPHGCDSYVSWSVKNKMQFKDILLGALLYLLGQYITFIQLNGQFIWEYAKKHPLMMSLLGFPISYIFLLATKYLSTYLRVGSSIFGQRS